MREQVYSGEPSDPAQSSVGLLAPWRPAHHRREQHFLVPASITDLQDEGVAVVTVFQVMRRAARWELRTFREKLSFARVSDQHRLTFQDVDELILPFMLVIYHRPCTGGQPGQVRTEMARPKGSPSGRSVRAAMREASSAGKPGENPRGAASAAFIALPL